MWEGGVMHRQGRSPPERRLGLRCRDEGRHRGLFWSGLVADVVETDG